MDEPPGKGNELHLAVGIDSEPREKFLALLNQPCLAGARDGEADSHADGQGSKRECEKREDFPCWFLFHGILLLLQDTVLMTVDTWIDLLVMCAPMRARASCACSSPCAGWR